MNTIKIYLAKSGALAQLQKDFPLYQYQFNNKLLNIFVPTSICAGNFIDENISEGYACQVKMDYMDSQNKQHRTGAFYCRYVKTLTQNGVEYALFERTLPYAFTLYAGQGVGAPTLTITIVNVAEHDGAPAVISTISSQECALDVLPSTAVADIDEPTDPDVITELEAKMTTIISQLALKQNADTTDDGVGKVINPDGDNHKVVDNINDLLQDNDTNQENIGQLQEDMAQAQNDIEALRQAFASGIKYIGTMEETALPTDQDVSDFVEDETGNPPALGNLVVVLVNTSELDTVYLYIYGATGWQHFEVQLLNNAQNGIKGVIAGNYNISGLQISDNFMVDIVNGIIVNIYRVNGNGDYIDLKSALDQVIAKLVGNTPVNRATADKNGNDIYDTYQTKQEGASKDWSLQAFQPKALYDLNYPDYALGQYKSANVSDTSYNKTTNSTSVGYTTLATITKSLEADILLGDQNGLVNRLWIGANITEDVKLRITTAYIDGNNQTQTLSVEETDTFGLVSGIAKLLQIESVFSGLTQPITLPAGTTLVQTIEVWRESSASADFTLLSNTTYSAYMTFNKIGFVRYSLEAEPDAIVSGHDSAPTIDSDGDLYVSSVDGEINYKNGDSAPLTTILKIPMDNGLSDTTSVLPARAGQVKSELDGCVKKTGAQSISGQKTFDQPVISQGYKTKSNADRFENPTASATIQLGNGRIDMNANSSGFRMGGVLNPDENNSRNIGAYDRKWKDLYLAGNLSDGTNSISVANIANKNTIPSTIIERLDSNTLPTATESSSDYVQLANGKLYRKKVVESAGITWLINEIPSKPSSDISASISFTSNGNSYTSITLYRSTVLWGDGGIQYDTTVVYGANNGWTSNDYRTITITSGSNADLNTWLEANATQSGGITYTYEEFFSGDYNDLINKPDLSTYTTQNDLSIGLASKQDALTIQEFEVVATDYSQSIYNQYNLGSFVLGAGTWLISSHFNGGGGSMGTYGLMVKVPDSSNYVVGASGNDLAGDLQGFIVGPGSRSANQNSTWGTTLSGIVKLDSQTTIYIAGYNPSSASSLKFKIRAVKLA